ncbi:MAG: cytochrome c oxidase subunit 3 [Burkholderiales bacterium]|nr:cytochrome c oxidase subunit 3 [Phycisphaerae bacterium]
MALAVRYAQLGQKTALVVCLALTILGGAGFMVIKTIEYQTKWQHHLFPGQYNVFNKDFKGDEKPPNDLSAHHGDFAPAPPPTTTTAAASTAPSTRPAAYFDPLAGTPDEPKIKPSFVDPQGLASANASLETYHPLTFDRLSPLDRERVGTFFSIYFMMTGLHGFHVVLGMGLILWILIRARKNEFGPEYFTPVDLVGLYWHLVDLIWIFLFPLLYLIH